MEKLRLLVWSPHIAPGGGARLLTQLIPALARSPRVEFVRLAVPKGSVSATDVNAGGKLPLEILALDPKKLRDLPEWLAEPGRVFGIRGTGKLKQQLAGRLQHVTGRYLHHVAQGAARDCDLVYVFWPHLYPYIGVDKPVVCTFHDITLFDYPEIAGKEKTEAEQRTSEVWLRRSDRIVAPSHSTKADLVRVFGKHLESAAVINHAILPDSPTAAARESVLAAKLPPRYVVWASGLASHKNHANLLLAWARFDRRKQFPLVLLGHNTDALATGKYRDFWVLNRLTGIIRRKGLRHGEDFYGMGHVAEEDLMPVISKATALIMPSMAEGGGSYPVEEALSVGVPVLCSDIPVMREHLAGHSAKVAWFDGESVSSIVDALNRFFDNYEEYKESAIGGMSDPRPTWDDIAAKYVELFLEVLREPRSRSGARTGARPGAR